jgi:hypothetical protein
LRIHGRPMRCRRNVSNVRQRPVIRFHIHYGCVSECDPISPCSSRRPGLNQATKQGSRPNRLLHFQAFPFVLVTRVALAANPRGTSGHCSALSRSGRRIPGRGQSAS